MPACNTFFRRVRSLHRRGLPPTRSRLVMGRFGASIVSAGMAISMLVTLNGTIMSGARVPYAVARDGYFFSALAEVHPRFHTPSVAIVVQAVLVDHAPAARRKFPPALFSGHFCRMALLHDRRQHRLRLPLARSQCSPGLIACSDIRLSRAVFIAVAAALLAYTFWGNSRTLGMDYS